MKRILFLLTLITYLSVNIYGQAIPKQFDYQGVLKTSAGGTVPDGNYPMTFKIYNEPTSGTALWTEAQTVAVANGIFSVHLGNSTPITGVPFDRVHFLGIALGAEPELLPRTMLTPSPYSFMSMNIMDAIVTTEKIQNGAVTDAKIGTNQVVKSLNGIKDDVTLVAGTNITLTPSGNNLTINAAGGGGGGTVTQVNTGTGLTGGPITTTGTISVSNDGITNVMLQNNSVTSAKITDGTITAADISGTQIVKSINTLKDDVTLVAGSNISITPSGQNLTIAATAGGLGGSGTINYLPKFSGTTTLGNSALFESAGRIGLGTITPDFNLTVNSESTAGLGVKVSRGTGGLIGLAIMEDSQPTGLRGWAFEVYQQKLTIKTTQDNGITTVRNLLAFDRDGNIGIGTTSPAYPLDLNKSNITSVIHSTNTAGSSSASAAAVFGQSNTADYYGYGGYFIGGWRGVMASVTPSGGSTYYGIYGLVSGGTSPAGTRYGLYGNAQGTGTGSRYGVYGYATGGTTNYGGYFFGNVGVSGTLTKGGGSFKIDHPLDPANKYLYHSFVESPDMMNIYNGNVVTDGSGYATVTLPDWFEALNKDFRYQLTVIGDFAQAIIAKEVQSNQFVIRTDKSNVKVSWQVTGIRKDAFAEKYRIPVEEKKKDAEIGKYLYPDAFGMPESLNVEYERVREGVERE